MIELEELRKRLSYDPETGKLLWKSKKSNLSRIIIGSEAGCLSKDGYRIVRIDKKNYLAHRLAWLIYYGSLPDNMIDHINGMKSDNRIVNLREADQFENQYNRKLSHNSTTKLKGVYFHKTKQVYRGTCCVNGKRYYFSPFDTAEAAFEAVSLFRENKHGEFFNNGN